MAQLIWANCGWINPDAPETYPDERSEYDFKEIPNHAHTGPSCVFCAQYRDFVKRGALEAALAHGDAPWQRKATIWVETRDSGTQFTADDLVAACSLPDWLNSNSIGALFNKLARAGTIQAVGYTTAKRLSSHSRTIRIWERS